MLIALIIENLGYAVCLIFANRIQDRDTRSRWLNRLGFLFPTIISMTIITFILI